MKPSTQQTITGTALLLSLALNIWLSELKINQAEASEINWLEKQGYSTDNGYFSSENLHLWSRRIVELYTDKGTYHVFCKQWTEYGAHGDKKPYPFLTQNSDAAQDLANACAIINHGAEF